jgi:uncharacterized protein YjbI with pentapeptide repeats
MSERPMTNDSDAWEAYWTAQGEPWRIEPEIDAERQRYLAERQTIIPDIEQSIYPFKGIRLTRADIEWLLHEHGPINWSDEQQRKRQGLDFRGAILNHPDHQHTVNLRHLPLANTRFGLTRAEWIQSSPEQQETATAHLEGTDLVDAYLEGADLMGAHLEGAIISSAHLEDADLMHVHLEGAVVQYAHLEGADLVDAHLEAADLSNAHLEGAFLVDAHLEGAFLHSVHLEGAFLMNAHLEAADLSSAHLEGAFLHGAHLEAIRFSDDDYHRIQQSLAKRLNSGTIKQNLPPANLCGVFFDTATQLNDITLPTHSLGISIADIHWGNANLSVIRWKQRGYTTVSDEVQGQGVDETKTRMEKWETTVRAYRQLSMALHSQGMNELANQFAYRAQLCQRRFLHMQGWHELPSYWGSYLLDFISGYGYRPMRSVFTYVLVIIAFSAIYFALGGGSHLVTIQESIVISMTAFHGRGFFATAFQPNDPQAIVAAVEAFIGLCMEVICIVTFTQRFFSR